MASSPVHKLLHVLVCICLFKGSSMERTSFVSVSVGDTATIQCRLRHKPQQDGVHVKTFLYEEKNVSYFFHEGVFSSSQPYTNRVNSNKNVSNFILYIHNVTMNDSGVYWCEFNNKDKGQKTVSLSMERYLLVVSENDVQCPGGQGSSFETLIIVCVVTASCMVLSIITIILVWGIPKVKRCCEHGNYTPTQPPSVSGSTHFQQPLNSEYEVMHAHRQEA